MRIIYTAPLFVWFILACGGKDLGDMVPTSSGYQARLDALVGKRINIAFRELGAPTRTVDISGESRLYVWEEKSSLRTPATGHAHRDPQTGSESIVIRPSERVPLDCFTELETDASGIVTRTRVDGIACVATPPGPDYASASIPLPAPPVSAPLEGAGDGGSYAGEDADAVGMAAEGANATLLPMPGAAIRAPGDPGSRADRRAQRRADRAAGRKGTRDQEE